ncbi:hypothetical protein OHB26_39500 (plasmid) [Nocardia sp. NBC_01503]|uniref:hypothetical protein n=1 Tax=Nocardia sp. NBC_01503 TaxID=2975997 RepID=UPI002E7AF5F3|nr:hypothetical protein [Nocardia sp. NBC_01503]WTL36682.1 hypothetical protein OHB26_39075 [Nocardia sp. NBC_01503]WTL36765.1 hypothetical protein OHB26_39500 [Nocardia sp. NBC_01503]
MIDDTTEPRSFDEIADEVVARVEERGRKAAAAWEPARSMEGLVLQVIGCWELVVSEVNAVYFHAAGPDAQPADARKLAATIRKAAEIYHIRWPHDRWANAVEQVSKGARHRLAHLLYVDEVTGERPDRTMTFVRLGRPGAPKKSPSGRRTIPRRGRRLHGMPGRSRTPRDEHARSADPGECISYTVMISLCSVMCVVP